MRNFLKATLLDGSEVVAEFSKLQGSGERYVGQVFYAAKPFNAWRVLRHTHPVSGEAVLVRTREMYNGNQIKKVERVQPKADVTSQQIGTLDPQYFESCPEIQGTAFGLWTAPAENTPEGAVAGVSYPIHRNEQTLERYVILRVENGDEPALRFQIEAARSTSESTVDELIGGSGTVDEPEHRPIRSEPSDADDDLDA
jgi:hypothetical protein